MKVPTLWTLICGECRAGIRRYSGTDIGTRFQQLIAHLGTGTHRDPHLTDMTLGDFLDPTRTASGISLVNAVTRDVNLDAQEWTTVRLYDMVAQIQHEAEERRKQRQQNQ